MKTKFIISLFALVFAYGCIAKKAVAPTHKVVQSVPFRTVVATEATMAKKPEVTAETLAEGKSLYGMNCAKCHELYDAKSFTAEEWTPIVLRMQKKARISDEQREKIYAYLTTP